jgi:hypothetical protein
VLSALFESEPFAIFAKARVLFNEILFAQRKKRRELAHFGIREADFAG